MMSYHRWMRLSFLCVFLAALSLFNVTAAGQTLRQQLETIYMLRAGDQTNFLEVDSRCDKLLQDNQSREDQGEIYFAWAQFYATSGGAMKMPGKTIELVRKALEYPLDPVKRLQMFVYWGDAMQFASPGVTGEDLAAARRRAVMPYLSGLKEALDQDLLDEKPEMPGVGFFTYDGPSDSKEYRELKRRQDKLIEAQRIARFQQDMIQFRDVLTGQVAFLYSRMPFAEDEIRKLATDTLQDEKAVKRLMSAVEAAMEERTKHFVIGAPNPRENTDDSPDEEAPVTLAKAPEPAPPQKESPPPAQATAPVAAQPPPQPPPAASSRTWVFLSVACGIGIAALAYVIFRRKRSGVKE